MKRIYSIAAVLLMLCITLCACGKVQKAEKLIDEIGEVTADSGPQIEAAEQAIAELDTEQKEKLRISIFLKKQNSNMQTLLKSRRKMIKK